MKQKYINKEEWIIRLIQGMIGDYGNENNTSECWYYNGHFKHKFEEQTFELNINDVNPITKFWITDTKGIPTKPLNIINIKG